MLLPSGMVGAVDHDRDGRQDKMEGLGRGSQELKILTTMFIRARESSAVAQLQHRFMQY